MITSFHKSPGAWEGGDPGDVDGDVGVVLRAWPLAELNLCIEKDRNKGMNKTCIYIL